MAEIPGQGGFIKMEYVPNRSGTSQFVGSVSRATYVFGGKRKFGYVDGRDVEGFLKIMDGNRPAFRRVNEAPAHTSANDTPPIETRRIVITKGDGTLTDNPADAVREIDAPDANEVAEMEDEQTGGEIRGSDYDPTVTISAKPEPVLTVTKPKAPRKSVASKTKAKPKAK